MRMIEEILTQLNQLRLELSDHPGINGFAYFVDVDGACFEDGEDVVCYNHSRCVDTAHFVGYLETVKHEVLSRKRDADGV